MHEADQRLGPMGVAGINGVVFLKRLYICTTTSSTDCMGMHSCRQLRFEMPSICASSGPQVVLNNVNCAHPQLGPREKVDVLLVVGQVDWAQYYYNR